MKDPAFVGALSAAAIRSEDEKAGEIKSKGTDKVAQQASLSKIPSVNKMASTNTAILYLPIHLTWVTRLITKDTVKYSGTGKSISRSFARLWE